MSGEPPQGDKRSVVGHTCRRAMRCPQLALVSVVTTLCAAPACSSEEYLEHHGVVTGDLVLTERGLRHPLFGEPLLTIDAGVNRATAIARFDLSFQGSPLGAFSLVVSTGLTRQSPPQITAPITAQAEYDETDRGMRVQLPVRGILTANSLALVCEGEDGTGLCAVRVPRGELEVSTSTESLVRIDGTLEFSTDPRLETR